MPILDVVFEMGSGYVLDFSNASFASFFEEEIGVNIEAPQFHAEGGSKGKRLRYFLRHASQDIALKTLLALWEYRTASNILVDDDGLSPKIESAFFEIVCRLGGNPPVSKSTAETDIPKFRGNDLRALEKKLFAVSKLEPHPRGYAFEKFLKELFDVYGMGSRASFRLTGEQIDGSFYHGNDTYLLEAKWTNLKVDAATLRSFNAKVEDKAAWSRGLLISHAGFTREGLTAFGRGKSVICMDGLDIYEILNNHLSLPVVIAAKARQAAETGCPFVSVRELTQGDGLSCS
ncbi:MAG: hypothetical protein COB69_09530 [Phycisphaera sp.]|nr:MAG: hypothetical protein COB69_09530 [Phycisphaera sp.]